MKNSFKRFFKASAKKKVVNSKKNSSTKRNDFDFTVISKEERLTNRCDKYNFIVQ